MNLSRRQLSTCLLLVCLGCGSGAVKEMAGTAPPPAWDALETFTGEPVMSVGYPLDMGDLKGAKSALKSKQFSDGLAAFESSALPGDYSTKQAEKDALVKAWKDAVAAADSSTPDEFKAAVKAAMDTIGPLRN